MMAWERTHRALIDEPKLMNVNPNPLPRVLFVGDDWYGSNATSLRNAVIRNGHECLTFDSTPMQGSGLPRRLARRLSPSFRTRAEWNAELVALLTTWRPDVLLVFRGLAVTAETLAATSALRIHYHPDDSTNPDNRSPVYDIAETAYDFHVTTKSFNVAELMARGVANAVYMPCAYDRDWHRPASQTVSASYRVGFIGTRRPDRTALVYGLADECGKSFLLCGDRWRRDPRIVRKATVRGPQYGFNLSTTVAQAPVQLGLLNSANRDQHTCRSYEIPAAGGLLIAERTDEHMTMLADQEEALFFSSPEELRSHLQRAAREPARMSELAQAASRRIRQGHNTYDDRWTTILDAIG